MEEIPNTAQKLSVKIACQPHDPIALSELNSLQGELKDLTDENYAKLRNSILELDFSFPFFIWIDNGKIYTADGHQRDRVLTRMKTEGVELPDKFPAFEVMAKDKVEAKKKLLALNSSFGKITEEGLYSFMNEEGFGIDPLEVEDYVSIPEFEMEYGEKQGVTEDEAPEVSKDPAISQIGEVYQLGRHKLMCGDSTKIEDVEKLMDGQKADMVFTDPPYGVSYGDKNKFLNAISPGNRIQENIDNDTKSVLEMKKLWIDAFTNMNTVTKAGGSYYVCSPQGGELMMMMMMSLLEAGWELKQSIIWVKNNHVLGRSDYHYRHEPILYGWKEGEAHKFYGGAGETTTWFIDKSHKSDLHPTMKPLALMIKAISNSSKAEDIILDPFLGSGSTLISAEQINRNCYGLESDPKYCDVIRKRYAKFIGKENEWQEVTTIVTT